jgi:hypothetical protein
MANLNLGFDIQLELLLKGDKPYLQLCNYCFIADLHLCFLSENLCHCLEAINAKVYVVECF